MTRRQTSRYHLFILSAILFVTGCTIHNQRVDRRQVGRYGAEYGHVFRFSSPIYTDKNTHEQYVFMARMVGDESGYIPHIPRYFINSQTFKMDTPTIVHESLAPENLKNNCTQSTEIYTIELIETHQPDHPQLSTVSVTVRPKQSL